MRQATSFTLTLAALLAAAGASAGTVTEAMKLPSFDTAAQNCEAIPGYDPQWASHGLDYGAGRKSDDGRFISGFYQLAGDGRHVYAAFAGLLTANRAAVGGVTPGALAVLDADTLALQRFIPLPFHAYALSLQPAQKRAIVSHTRAGAFSIVDLQSGQSRCFRPDTKAGEKSFRARYVSSDAEGNFYIGYYSGWGEGVHSTLAKFDGQGRPAASFTPRVTENAMALPVLQRNDRIYTGSQGLVAVDPQSGGVQRILPQNKGWNIYNYAAGPGDALLAVNYQSEPSPNLVLLDPASNGLSAIFTAIGSLEAAHVPEGAQVFSTNFTSRTVTVAELPAGGGGLDGRRFVNIAFEGAPLGLYAHRTVRGTEAFVTTRLNEEWPKDRQLIHKITLAPSVRGIDGIEKAGACTVTSFDLKDRSVSAPQPCRILDAPASYAALREQAREGAAAIEASLRETGQKLDAARAELQQARQAKAGAETLAGRQQQVEKLEKDLADGQKARAREQSSLEIFTRLAGD